MTPTSVIVDVLIEPDEGSAALRADVRRGLSSQPKTLPPKWFYDNRGCELFDQITRLPEYYPTEAERSILVAEAAAIAETSMADTIVELGSGTSDKTRTLLDTFSGTGQLTRFIPFEVNESTVRAAAEAIAIEYPGITVHAVVGDFETSLGAIPRQGRRLITFLGSTIGNFVPEQRHRFLTELAANLVPGDSLLLGTDLVKDTARLEAAYNDRQGVTAEFNRNVLAVVNRELGADFDLEAFAHQAWFDSDHEWIEMHLVARSDQVVTVPALDLIVCFRENESLRTEISAKFHRGVIEAELEGVGLRPIRWMTDAAGDFGLTLAIRQ